MAINSRITIETIYQKSYAYPSMWYMIGYDQEHYVYILLVRYRSNLLYISVVGTDNDLLVNQLNLRKTHDLLFTYLPELKNESEMTLSQLKRLTRYIIEVPKTVTVVDKTRFYQLMYKIESEPNYKLLSDCLHEDNVKTIVIDASDFNDDSEDSSEQSY